MTLTLIPILLATQVVSADIAVVVHPDNPIKKLSQKDVQRLFLGRMDHFPNTRLKVESLDDKEGSQPYLNFYGQVIRMSASKLKRYRAYYLFSGKGKLPASLNGADNLIKYVAQANGAIAYVPLEKVTDKVKVVYTYK